MRGMGMSEQECRCGKPTRDAAYVCDSCSEEFAQALGDVPWLDEQLEITVTRLSGVDYRTVGGKNGRSAPRGDKRIAGDVTTEPPSADAPALGAHLQSEPLNWAAADARGHLKALLVSWVRFCDEEHVRNSSPYVGLPEDNLTALSRWMLWRVDGLALLDIGTEAVDEITSAVAHCRRLIDRHPERQYLGRCGFCSEGSLYATPNSAWARCNSCDTAIDADAIRKRLLTELDDRLCTAAEIAHLSTYLGLKAGREQVRNRINQWHSRGQVESGSMFGDAPAFRFGSVYAMLIAAEYGSKDTQAASA